MAQFITTERDASTENKDNITDCILAGPVNRRLKSEYVASCALSHIRINRKDDEYQIMPVFSHILSMELQNEIVNYCDKKGKVGLVFELPIPDEFLKEETAQEIADKFWNMYFEKVRLATNVQTVIDAWEEYQTSLKEENIIATLEGYKFSPNGD